MESLNEFHARVDGFQRDSLPHDGPLTTKPLLVESSPTVRTAVRITASRSSTASCLG